MTDECLREMAHAAREIAQHIKRYWSVDGEPINHNIPMWGNVKTLRRGVDLIKALLSQSDDSYPGPVIELQLRALVFEWNQLVPSSNIPWPSPAIQLAASPIVLGMSRIVVAMLPGVPESFNGEDLDLIIDGVDALLDAIAFVPNERQTEILDALEHRAMTGEQLLAKLIIGSKQTLYGKNGRGGLNELKDRGYIALDRRLGGYFRPDCPPE